MKLRKEFEKETGLKVEITHSISAKTVTIVNTEYVKWLEGTIDKGTKGISIEDIFIEIEAIFDNTKSGWERRKEVYQKLNELIPKWEGFKTNNKK